MTAAAHAWVTISRHSTDVEANVVKGVLDSAGIPARLANEAIVGVAWHLSNLVGGVEVQVRAEDEEVARTCLDQAGYLGPEALEPEDDDAPAEPSPPADPRPDKAKLARHALLASVFGFMFPVVLQLWSLVLLVRMPAAPGELTPRATRHAAFALLLDVAALAFIAWAFQGAR